MLKWLAFKKSYGSAYMFVSLYVCEYCNVVAALSFKG